MGHSQNLKPWPKGVSGNPGGRPKKKLVTDELERLLQVEAPDAGGKTWATVIAQALLQQARKGDVRAFAELTNRIEGKPLQPVELRGDDCFRPASRHSFFFERRPSFSAAACNWFIIRVRACTIRCRCHSSCRRSRFSQLNPLSPYPETQFAESSGGNRIL
jgi:uncharacterized protein DUF5681